MFQKRIKLNRKLNYTFMTILIMYLIMKSFPRVHSRKDRIVFILNKFTLSESTVIPMQGVEQGEKGEKLHWTNQ